MQRTLSTVTGDSYSCKSDSENEVMYTNKSSGFFTEWQQEETYYLFVLFKARA